MMTPPTDAALRRSAPWIVCLVGLATIAPQVQAGIPADLQAQRKQRIESLSPAARERLARNLEAYKSFTEAEREYYRELQRELSQDSSLQEILREYLEWFGTLSEEEQAKIRTETSPVRRQELVRSLRLAHPPAKPTEAAKSPETETSLPNSPTSGAPQAPQEIVITDSASAQDSDPGPTEFFLNKEDLAAVMAIMEEKLLAAEVTTPIEAERLKSLSGTDRYVYLLELVYTHRRGSDESQRWMPRAVGQMTAAISNPEQRKKLESESPSSRSNDLMFLVRRGVVRQLAQEIEQDRGRRENVWDKLLFEQQERIQKLPDSEQAEAIAYNYLFNAFPRFTRNGAFGRGTLSGGKQQSGDRQPKSGSENNRQSDE